MAVRSEGGGHVQTTRKRALYVAAENGHARAVQTLLSAGADPHALSSIESEESVSRMSALFVARRAQHDAVVALLEAAGAQEVSTTEL